MFKTSPLSQRDARWSGVQLGFGEADSTIGNYGCTLTCVTMLCNGYGLNETPISLNDKLKAMGDGVGYAGDTRNLFVFSNVNVVAPGVKYKDRAWCYDTPAPMDRIHAELDRGKAIVIQLDQSPSPNFQQHWVLLYGREGTDYLIHDPWLLPAQARVPIVRDYGFAGSIEQIITHCVFYEGNTPTPNPTPPPNPSPAMTVVIMNDPDIAALGGLALREQPSVMGKLIKRLPVGSELAIKENASSAMQKVGMIGEWLHVATNGSEGYVAAWLVTAVIKTATGTRGLPDVILRGAQAEVQPAWNSPMLVVKQPKKQSKAKNPPSPNLRTRAGGEGKLIAELRPNTPLKIMESEQSALPKLGVRGEWIKVQDDEGRVGYVSAMFVQLKKSTGKDNGKKDVKG